jgi:GNAT superfamily N-acetyltransferase
VVSVSHPEDVSYRAFDPAGDYPVLVGLIHASNRFDRVDDLPTVENLRSEQSHIEGFDPRDDMLLAEIDGSLRAAARTIARTRDGRGSHHFEAWVAPGSRGRGIGTALLAWIEQRARQVAAVDGRAGPRELQTWIGETQLGAVTLLEAHGYQIGRYGFLMTRDIREPIEPLALADGLEIRPVEETHHRQIWTPTPRRFATTGTAPNGPRPTTKPGSPSPSSIRACGGSPGRATRWPGS